MFYPLNVLRTRLQVSESKEMDSFISLAGKIVQNEGLGGLFSGWHSQVVALAASNFVYFYQYNGIKAVVRKMKQDRGMPTELSTGGNLIIASIAGVINVLCTTPLWVVSTRIAVQSRQKAGTGQNYAGLVDGLGTIVKDEGILGLWNGTGPSLMLVSNPVVQFVVYERIRRILAARASSRGSPITTLEFFLMGALAKG